MDLHLAPFDRAYEVTALPGDLAVLMVGIAARQAASATAIAQMGSWAPEDYRADPLLFRPVHGAFNGAMAAMVRSWSEE